MSELLTRKVNRVLAERIDSPELVSALKHLSTFYDENTLENRRNLRTVLEKQGRTLNDQFIASFEGIVDDFDKVAKCVDGLSRECQHIEKILNQSKDATNSLIATTTKLRQQKTEVERKEEIVSTFLARFQLTSAEKLTFNTFLYENVVVFALFDVFERMLLIRDDCKRLLTDYHQRASLDIMDRFAKQLETGYEKLYRWVQKSARALGTDVHALMKTYQRHSHHVLATREDDDEDDKPKVTQNSDKNGTKDAASGQTATATADDGELDLELFSHALFQLRQRSGYFEHCFQELAAARRLYLVQRFLNALTRGEPTTATTQSHGMTTSRTPSFTRVSGASDAVATVGDTSRMSKPLEMYAYDPVRYLNDMLTWIHDALQQERQFSLFAFRVPPRIQQKRLLSMTDDADDDKVKEYSSQQLMTYLDRVCEGLFRPLNMRVLSILNTSGAGSSGTNDRFDVVTAYRLCHVMDFSAITIGHLFQFETPESKSQPQQTAVGDGDDKKEASATLQLKFMTSLQDLQRTSYDKFYKMVQQRMDKFLDAASGGGNNSKASGKANAALSGISISLELTPHQLFKDHLDRLHDIMSIYATNLLSTHQRQIENFTAVLNSFIDPMLQVVHKSIVNLTETEKCVYLINVLVLILDVLETESFAKHSARYETLSLLIETQKEKLVENESSFILKDCGVFTTLFTLQQFKQTQRPNSTQRVCDVQGLDETAMQMAIKSLTAYIFSLGALSMPKIEKIANLQIRSMVRNGVANVIFSAYKSLYDTLANKQNGYENCEQELSNSPERVKQMLQIK